MYGYGLYSRYGNNVYGFRRGEENSDLLTNNQLFNKGITQWSYLYHKQASLYTVYGNFDIIQQIKCNIFRETFVYETHYKYLSVMLN
jgi:hypothetical protein